MPSAELQQAYDAYHERVRANLGEVDVGGYAKVQGRLIKVLGLDEFERRYLEYQHVQQAFEQSMARGDTVNDAIVQVLRERAAELLLDPAL
jgi:hypothetical protein